MKKLLFWVLLLFSVAPLFAQSGEKALTIVPDKVYESVDELAKYRTGYEAFYKLIQEKMICNREKLYKKKDAEIVIRFIIEKNGSLTSPEIISSDLPHCNDEILRAVAGNKNWVPAKKEGKIVRSYVTIPVKLLKNK